MSSVRRNVEVPDRALNMRRNSVPVELWIKFGKISWRSIAELLIHPDFFEFEIECICFAQVMWITELANQIRSAHQVAFFIVVIVGTLSRWKTRAFNRVGDAGGIQ